FESAGDFTDGLAWFELDDRYGFVDKNGKIAINPQFDEAKPFENGLAHVKLGRGQWGYVDKTGKFIWNPTK
ncbi:MAG: WG repeat-containing protein, partial [Acidobacteria bacterium]|nr:WG repeat-containing protein [Acidobacteriota bacterium]